MDPGDQKSRGERERARSAEARTVRADAREADADERAIVADAHEADADALRQARGSHKRQPGVSARPLPLDATCQASDGQPAAGHRRRSRNPEGQD